FAIEPFLTLETQRRVWSGLYICFVILVAAAALIRRRRAVPDEPWHPREAPGRSQTWRARFRWMALSAVPSSLMLSVTTFISTDIAAVPLLWVVPLSLYLVTFVVAFSARGTAAIRVAIKFLPLVVVPALILAVGEVDTGLAGIPIHLAA